MPAHRRGKPACASTTSSINSTSTIVLIYDRREGQKPVGTLDGAALQELKSPQAAYRTVLWDRGEQDGTLRRKNAHQCAAVPPAVEVVPGVRRPPSS